jgi:hypothetical protein
LSREVVEDIEEIMKMEEEANHPLDFAKFLELMMIVEVLY